MKKLIAFAFLTIASSICWGDSLTPRLGLTLPTIGSPTWGQKINGNFQILDSTVTAGSILAGATYYINNVAVTPGTTVFMISSGTVTGNFYDLSLTSGNCVQAGSGGILLTTSLPCGSGSGGGGVSLSTASFGTLYTSSSNVTQTGIGTTPAILSVFNSSGDVSLVTASTSTGQILVTTTTAYFLWANILSTGSGVSFQYFSINVNGVSTGFTCQDTPSSRCSFGGVKNLTAGSTVAIYVSANVAGSTVTITDAQLVVMSVGGGSGSGGGGSGTITSVNAGVGIAVTNPSGPSVTVNLSPSATMYIQNLANPAVSTQTNSGFNVTTGTITGVFTVTQPDNDTTDPPIQLKTLTTKEGAANTYHSFFLDGIIPNPPANGGEFIITTSSIPLTSSVGGFTDRLDRPEIAMATSENNGNFQSYIALRSVAHQFPNAAPLGDLEIRASSVVVQSPLLLSYGSANQTVCTDSNSILRTSGCASSLVSGATNYIQNRNTLQAGSTAYPAFVYVGSSLTAPTIVDSGIPSGQCVQTGTGGLLQGTGSACGAGGGGVSVYPATSTVTGIFYQSLFAAQSKLGVFGEAAPFISNSTAELTAGAYFDDTSTQAVSWTFRMHNYSGRQLTADIVSHSTNTANFTCWEIYTSTNFVSSALATQNQDLATQFNVGVTTAVRVNPNQMAPTMASVALSNTTVLNGDMLTIKLERQTGGCSNTNSVGFARMTEVDIRE